MRPLFFKTPLIRALKAAAGAGFLILAVAGCSSVPKSSLPAVNAEVVRRGGPASAWPQVTDEESSRTAVVAEILAHDLSPESAVQLALLNNRALRATLDELGVSQADLLAAGRLHNPTLSASVRWPSQRPRGPNVGISLVADVVDDLLIPLRKSVAREQLAQAERRVAHEVLALAADVKTAVFTVQARQEFRARLASVVEVNEAAADLAQRQYDAGNINQLELFNQHVLAQEAKQQLARTDAEVRSDRERLNRLLGLAGAQTKWKIPAGLSALPKEESSLDEVEEWAIEHRLDLAVSKSQIALAQRALSITRKTRWLPVSAGVETEREVDGSRVTGPTLEVRLPIFDQGQAEIARLTAEVNRASHLHEALANDIRSEAREAKDALLAARAAAGYYETTLLPLRRQLLHETLLHYNAMQKSNYELLAAKERLLLTERESIEALRDYWIARTHLERVIGGTLPSSSSSRETEHRAEPATPSSP